MFEIKRFNLIREGDIVVDGVIFPNSKCVMIWRGDVNSIVIHENIDDIIKIHCKWGTIINYID
jgi:hypothetical protein